MSQRDQAPRWLGPAALLVFALSGCSGLIYQSVWSQYLGLYLGHAAYAQSLVLAIFMGGMAIGAFWASRRSTGWRNLLRSYAIIELVIGVAALAFHPIYVALTGAAYSSIFPSLPGAFTVQAFKWGSGALLILPQAILLGMTFPLMSSGLMRRLRVGDGAILGGLYFTNSIGAAFGALFATFVLLPWIGMPGAMQFGAVLNIVVALAAFLLAREPEQPQQPAQASTEGKTSVARLLLVAAFITGATSFVYEIGWVRMLALVFGSTVHAFELMLAAFIGGLAFGGLWIRRRIDGYALPLRVGGWVQILMGLAAVASLLLYDRAFDWVAWFLQALSRSGGGYDLYNTVTASVSVLMMAPAAFFAGMTLPLFTLALIRSGGGEASVGRIYAANTIGAIVGVFAAVHLLIPYLGLKLAMVIAAAGDLVLGLALLRRESDAARQADRAYLAALALCGAALVAGLLFARFDPQAMSAGVYRTTVARTSAATGDKIIYYRDGKTASIAVRDNGDSLRSIVTNGKVDASLGIGKDMPTGSDENTMVLASLLPLLHHPQPRTAAIIGFGSGLSTHTLLGDKRLETVDTIEIEPAMVEGAKLFGERVARAYNDPRSHIHIEDARTFFAVNKTKYDIIMSEPSNPWVSGVASLFSTEFYDFVPNHLAPGGLFVQWVQLYEINDELVGSVVNALSSRFKDYRIYLAYNSDMLIVARKDGEIGPINPQVLDDPTLTTELTLQGLGTLAQVKSLAIGERKGLQALFHAVSSRANSDYYPILSLEAPRSRFIRQTADALARIPMADLPYRKEFGGLEPEPFAALSELSQSGYRAASGHAHDIATALRDGGPLYDLGSNASTVSYLLDSVGNCRDNADVKRQIDTLTQLAGRTVPFLSEGDNKSLWVTPNWIKCSEQPAAVKNALQAVAALASGDGKLLQQQADILLQQTPPVASAKARDWLVRAGMFGAVSAGDYGAAVAMERNYGATLTSSPPTEMIYRLWTLNLAYERGARPAAAADAKPGSGAN